MRSFHPTRAVGALIAQASFALLTSQMLCSANLAAQTVPSSPSTPSAAIPATSSLPAAQLTSNGAESKPQAAAQRVEVSVTGKDISVDANNASLNQVLREVALKSKIKMTGSVADERIFGHYGPDSPAAILAMLLDGTQSNMLLVGDPKGSVELILTPRHGAPTPPNPNAASGSGDQDNQDSQSANGFNPPTRPSGPPIDNGRAPANINPGFAVDPPASEDDPNNSNPPSNGTRTSQQIFEQLQKQRPPATITPQ